MSPNASPALLLRQVMTTECDAHGAGAGVRNLGGICCIRVILAVDVQKTQQTWPQISTPDTHARFVCQGLMGRSFITHPRGASVRSWGRIRCICVILGGNTRMGRRMLREPFIFQLRRNTTRL